MYCDQLIKHLVARTSKDGQFQEDSTAKPLLRMAFGRQGVIFGADFRDPNHPRR
jgi:hypothetical protein